MGAGATRSSIQAAGAPGGGFSASPKALVVLVMTKARTPSPRRRLEQDERPHDVRLDERRPRMGSDMRLVQRRGVEDRVGAVDAAGDAGEVGDRADLVGERPGDEVESDRRTARGPQRAHERFAQMA